MGVTIDLGLSAEQRWALSPAHIKTAQDLVVQYYLDMDGSEALMEIVNEAAQPQLQPDHWLEICAIAAQLGLSAEMVLLCNAYYDVATALLGCTAFAIDTDDGPLHARNLDWWTESKLLNTATTVVSYQNGPAGAFSGITWPGYIGMLSGVAKGRFAITLNAVLSDDPVQPAMPVSLLIRDIFETAKTYDEAVERLCRTPLSCSCLLLISGVEQGEMMVIERTPIRHAKRHPQGGYIAVANDYLTLDASGGAAGSIATTSCSRFARISHLLQSKPDKMAACITALSDPSVKLTITVQQMAFHARHGGLLYASP